MTVPIHKGSDMASQKELMDAVRDSEEVVVEGMIKDGMSDAALIAALGAAKDGTKVFSVLKAEKAAREKAATKPKKTKKKLGPK